MITYARSCWKATWSSACCAAIVCFALAGCSSGVSTPQLNADLVVAAPSASDDSPVAGGTFTLSVTVRNNGGRDASATTLRYYRSTDATITTADVQVALDAIAGLGASGSVGESAELTAPTTPGTYYYGACLDAVSDESDTKNNCSASVQIAVQAAGKASHGSPDLMVTAPSVSDSRPASGARFTLSATVSNAGGAAAATTTLRFYQSNDDTITTSDTAVGSEAMDELAASGSGSQSVDLTAPATPGTYYYGACVDAATDEADTTNNCSKSVPVTVPEAERPDLIVTQPSVSDSGPVTGARFTLSATVRNDGNGPAAATTLRYYRSTDATITKSDSQAGTAAVGGLAASGSASESVDLTAPATPGTYYFGACVDIVTDETDTTNNCSSSVQVTVQTTVTEPQGDPDLMVTSASVSDNGPSAGARFTLSAAVRNDGNGGAAATTLRYYRSADATITTTDTEVGTDAIAGLAASGSAGHSVDLTALATPGTYYYGACVDAVTGETDTTNNCSSSVQVTVPEPERPDLTVASLSVSDSSPSTGARFTLSATVRNDGTGGAAATTLRYYRSSDAAITTSDTPVGTVAIVGLAASGSASKSVDLTAPAMPGTYYYGACVDVVTSESNTANNCSSSVEVTILEPDLVVGTPSVNDSGPAEGAQFTLSATVRNEGEGDSETTTLRYYRSSDTAITTSDTEIGTDSIPGLSASGNSSKSVDLTAPAPGTYYYGACVDAVTDESDTANNCSASVSVTVPQPKPDLVVGSPSVNESGPAAGAGFTLSATVENDGNGTATATTLRYYQSTDATIATTDTEVGTDAIAGLAAAGTSDQSVDLTAPDTAGTYYYGACVDAVTDESDAANNCSTSVAVTVPDAQQQGAPSVEVSAEDDMEWAPVGDTVDLSARVLDDEGKEVTGTTVTWSSSNTAVATVNSSGVMTAVGVGTATLTATATVSGSSTRSSMAKSAVAGLHASGRAAATTEETVSASIDMEVVKRASRIEIAPDSLSFDTVGEVETLTATVYDQNDNVMQPTYWGWSSADQEVATVNGRFFGSGVQASVQSIGEGTTTVTLRANGSATGTASVTVTLPTARVTLSPASLTFDALGDTKMVTVTVVDENGDEVEDATFGYIGVFSPCCGGEFDINNPPKGIAIEKLDDGLEITAEGTGSGSYTVSSPDVASAILLVNVNQNPSTLTVSPDSASLQVDGTATLRASVMDANGYDIPLAEGDKGGLVVYWATSDSAVATVDGAGDHADRNTGATATVTAVAAGTATITGRWGSSITGTATITVTDGN